MSELKEVSWNNPMGMVLWLRESVPIRVTWDEWFDQTLSKWMESMRFEWIEVNRTIRGEMNELKDLTWMNPMAKSLWSEEGEPYESDLSEPNGNLPMSWEWVSLSIWLDWSQWESPYVQLNECPYQNDQIWLNRGRISE